MIKTHTVLKLLYMSFVLTTIIIFCCSCQSTITPTVKRTATPLPVSATPTITPTSSPSVTPTPSNQVVISSDGSITFNIEDVISPTISEDTHWMAVSVFSQQSDSYNVLVKDLQDIQNSEWRKLIFDNTSNSIYPYFQFSPDAEYLAVVTNEKIWIFRTGDWENPQKFTYKTYMRFFSWSPDSQGIAVAIQMDGNILYYLTMDGTITPLLKYIEVFPEGEPQLDQISREADIFFWGPGWSPDGKHIAFLTYKTESRELWNLDFATGKKNLLTSGEIGDRPTWSPDGKKIALIENNLQVFDVNKKTLVNILIDPFFLSTIHFVWSPDSSQLALQTAVDGGNIGMYSINIQTGESKILVKSGDNFDIFAWTQDNKVLLADNFSEKIVFAPILN
ncbi:MAG: hypothetical protein C0410_10965 [Anaerolinea sp.]|nr:hypothetical protein [Anaerolinea sp.]